MFSCVMKKNNKNLNHKKLFVLLFSFNHSQTLAEHPSSIRQKTQLHFQGPEKKMHANEQVVLYQGLQQGHKHTMEVSCCFYSSEPRNAT